MNLDLVYSSSAGDLITASSCGDDVVAPTSVDGAAIFSGNEDVVEFGPDDIFDVFEGVALGMSGETFAKFEGNLDSSRGIEVGHSVGSLFAVESVGSIEPFENVVSFVADQDIVLGRGDCVLGRVGAEKDVALSHLVGSFAEGGDGEFFEVYFDGVGGSAIVDTEAGDEVVEQVVGGDVVETGGGSDGGSADEEVASDRDFFDIYIAGEVGDEDLGGLGFEFGDGDEFLGGESDGDSDPLVGGKPGSGREEFVDSFGPLCDEADLKTLSFAGVDSGFLSVSADVPDG